MLVNKEFCLCKIDKSVLLYTYDTWANQKTELFMYSRLHANATFDLRPHFKGSLLIHYLKILT